MTHDDDRDLVDDVVSDALRRRAGEASGEVDVESALLVVLDRSRHRRRRRQVLTTAAAAAAVVVLVAAVGLLGGGTERYQVRTPTAPGLSPTSSAEPIGTPAPEGPSTSPSTTVTEVATTTTVTATTTSAPPALDPPTRSFSSAGGSISVQLVDGRISLAAEPEPSSGWSVRIDDDGPDRVRVRFERDDERSEIRVDLVNGELVERIDD